MFLVLTAAGACILGGVVDDGANGGTFSEGNPEEGRLPHDAPGQRDIREGPIGSTQDHIVILSTPQPGLRVVQSHKFVARSTL